MTSEIGAGPDCFNHIGTSYRYMIAFDIGAQDVKATVSQKTVAHIDCGHLIAGLFSS